MQMPMDDAQLLVKKQGPHGNVKATREDWLRVSLDALVSEGVESVRVLTLAQRLDVSRSSFYWYFRSRQDLLDQLLDHWRNTNTRFIIERALRPAPTVTQAVINVFECWVDEALFDQRLDFAIRAWARQSGAVRHIIDEADDARVAAIRDMFVRHGYTAQDAFVRARVLYYMQIGYYALELSEPLESRLALLPDYLRSFTGREPVAAEMAAFIDYARQHRRPGLAD